MIRPSVLNIIRVEAFDKVCEVLIMVHHERGTNWDLHVPAVLWAYRTTCKKLTEQTPPRLEYGANDVIPIKYKMPSPLIAALVDMMARGALEEGIAQLDKADRLGPEKEI